jgi:hypothetical protein
MSGTSQAATSGAVRRGIRSLTTRRRAEHAAPLRIGTDTDRAPVSRG